MTRIDADTLYGSLNLLILQALREGPRHGLAVSRRIHELAREAIRVEEGALYPALYRLQRDGLIEGEWGVSETKRRAKFYRLTTKGTNTLEREMGRWLRHAEAVASVLGVGVTWDPEP